MAEAGATASQAWAILKRHARDEMSPLRLQELCRDNDRVSSLVAVYNATPQRMLIVDLSRQSMTLETLNHLLRLTTARHIQKYITQLAWGQNDPDDPIVPLRVLQQQQQQAQARQQGDHHNHPAQYQPYHQQYTHQGPVPTVRSEDRHRKTTRFEEADEAGGARQQQQQQQQQYRTVAPSFSGEGPSSHRQNNNQNNTNDTTATTTPHIPVIPSLHLSLRAPVGQGLEIFTANGVNALTAIHSDWERMQRISESLRRGQWQGIT